MDVRKSPVVNFESDTQILCRENSTFEQH